MHVLFHSINTTTGGFSSKNKLYMKYSTKSIIYNAYNAIALTNKQLCIVCIEYIVQFSLRNMYCTYILYRKSHSCD